MFSNSTGSAGPRDRRGKPAAPGRPAEGPGSSAGYICSGYTRLEAGSVWDGSRVTCFVPARLRNRTDAPVVVFLHGYLMIATGLYRGLIDHLVYQGNIVVCPEANVGSPLRVIGDLDQNVFMRRAVGNVARGLAVLGAKADASDLYVAGHSLGGLMGACWMGAGGQPPRAVVLMNANNDPGSGMPGIVRGMVRITTLDWKSLSAATDVPVVILTGDEDVIAPPAQSVELYDAMVNAPSRSVYCLQGDDRGRRPLKAGHGACMSGPSVVPSFLTGLVTGGKGADTALSRFYLAALDQVLTGRTGCVFDMGAWSDGEPVKPVMKLAGP